MFSTQITGVLDIYEKKKKPNKSNKWVQDFFLKVELDWFTTYMS